MAFSLATSIPLVERVRYLVAAALHAPDKNRTCARGLGTLGRSCENCALAGRFEDQPRRATLGATVEPRSFTDPAEIRIRLAWRR